MRPHGGYAPPRLDTPKDARFAERAAQDYRNLFGTPTDPGDFFRGHGSSTPHEVSETTRILDAIAYRMGCPHPWKDALEQGIEKNENPNLPSGYTYLAQLVAHDVSFASSARPQIPGRPMDTRNFRGASLELDVVYGGSLTERPGAYCASAAEGPPERTRLRLGYYDDDTALSALSDEQKKRRARDIPRLDPDFRNDTAEGATDTLLADPRNDDQPIIAQIFVVFALLHNAVCDRLAHAPDGLIDPDDGVLGAARRVTTAVYRMIVENDLLRRVLNHEIYRRYAVEDPPLLDAAYADRRMPIEFSHAGFRFGHAMVRQDYRFRFKLFGLPDVLLRNSTFRPKRVPLDPSWIVKWSQFFEFAQRPVNLSLRLAPAMAGGLFDPAQFDGMDLARRDLLRGATRMRSVDSLIRILCENGIDLPGFLKDPCERQRAIRAWLDRPLWITHDLPGAPMFKDGDHDVIAADPPLLFFVLLEAAETEDGKRLGVLGSVIVAEVLFAAMRSDASGEYPPRQPVKPLLDFVFGANVPANMPDLIMFLDNHYAFAKSDVPFI